MTDSQFSRLIMERDSGLCRLCGRAGSESHHIFSRLHRSIRHDPENGIFLCKACHDWAHSSGRGAMEKIRPAMVLMYGDEWEKNLIWKRDKKLRVGG